MFKVPSVHADDAGRMASLDLGLVSSSNHVIVDTVKLPFAWAAAALQFHASTPCEVSVASDFASPDRSPSSAFVTPPSAAEQSNLQAELTDHLRQQPVSPRTPNQSPPLASEPVGDAHTMASDNSVTTPEIAFETPPHPSTPSSADCQCTTPVDALLDPHHRTHTPHSNEAATASRAPPPGTRVIIVRVFEAAGGVSPSVCLRSHCR